MQSQSTEKGQEWVVKEQPLLDTKSAAAYLALGARTLVEWRVRGGGPRFTKMNRTVRYRKSDLDQFVEERVRSSTSDTT